jgi:hypothetical protein
VHDKHLIDQVNAYAADDYTKAEKLQLEGYQQMLGVANPTPWSTPSSAR